VRPTPHFLDAEFVDSLGAVDLHHSWLDAPSGALPGKAAHIASILRVQPNLEASRGYHLPVLSPLMSQPILEACLSIPSWEWRAGGRDRSLARRAFANELPRTILERRVKGGPTGFSAKLLDHFRLPIRDLLLGGRLAANRIIDPLRIAEVLREDAPVNHPERLRILELVNAEAWIDHWTQRPLSRAGKPDIRSGAHARPLSSTGPIP
jgi:asparagine synthase (glutamine-hydrolysing)